MHSRYKTYVDHIVATDRISAELIKVDQNIFPFYTSIVEYPMNLSIIKSRLDNRFYRRAEAVEFDVNYLLTNACKFYKANSPIIRSASSATKLCLEMIRNRDAVEIPKNYQLLTTNRPHGPHSPASSGHPPDVPSAPSSPNSTENVTPDPSDLSNSVQLPTTNGSGKFELQRKGRPDATKLKSLRNRKVPPVSTLEPLEESTSEDEKPIRYFVFGFHTIISFLNYLFLYLIQSTKTNPRRQGELPHVVRQRLVIVHRFRQSVYWEPGPRNRAILHAEE